jgi:hypothetical protein
VNIGGNKAFFNLINVAVLHQNTSKLSLPPVAAMKFSIILALGLSQLSAAVADFANYNVYWPQEPQRIWKETTVDIQEKTGILRYALFEASKPRMYQYTLEVEIAKGWARTFRGREYNFQDSVQGSSPYGLTAHTSGVHSVDFDSDMPNIIRVGVEM